MFCVAIYCQLKNLFTFISSFDNLAQFFIQICQNFRIGIIALFNKGMSIIKQNKGYYSKNLVDVLKTESL